MKNQFLIPSFWGVLITLFSCQQSLPSTLQKWSPHLPEKVDFNYHIKPIFSDRCYQCHGPDDQARKSDLRLDIEEIAFKKLESNHRSIVPGSLSKSELFQRITSEEVDYKMPPPESKLALSDYEKALIGKWIRQGAEWKPHWSFIKPKRKDIPVVQKKDWVQQPIDQFILKKLEEKDIEPSEKADKETLLRRVTLDLTGLPPSIKEMDDYLADTSPNAFEKVVDRLLSSPHYGERMAADWMDVARYADTHGYLDDTPREAWHWRDWVIKAFNENLPYGIANQ